MVGHVPSDKHCPLTSSLWAYVYEERDPSENGGGIMITYRGCGGDDDDRNRRDHRVVRAAAADAAVKAISKASFLAGLRKLDKWIETVKADETGETGESKGNDSISSDGAGGGGADGDASGGGGGGGGGDDAGGLLQPSTHPLGSSGLQRIRDNIAHHGCIAENTIYYGEQQKQGSELVSILSLPRMLLVGSSSAAPRLPRTLERCVFVVTKTKTMYPLDFSACSYAIEFLNPDNNKLLPAYGGRYGEEARHSIWLPPAAGSDDGRGGVCEAIATSLGTDIGAVGAVLRCVALAAKAGSLRYHSSGSTSFPAPDTDMFGSVDVAQAYKKTDCLPQYPWYDDAPLIQSERDLVCGGEGVRAFPSLAMTSARRHVRWRWDGKEEGKKDPLDEDEVAYVRHWYSPSYHGVSTMVREYLEALPEDDAPGGNGLLVRAARLARISQTVSGRLREKQLAAAAEDAAEAAAKKEAYEAARRQREEEKAAAVTANAQEEAAAAAAAREQQGL